MKHRDRLILLSIHDLGLTGGKMEARVTLRPGDKGTKKLVREFGQKLLCVRYRYDPIKRMRHPVELVVKSAPRDPRGSPDPAAAGKAGDRPRSSALALSTARKICGVVSKRVADGGCPNRACGCYL